MSEEQSKFNYGIKYLEEIMRAQQNASTARMLEDYDLYYKSMQDLYIWLSPRMEEEEQTQTQKKLEKIERLVNNDMTSYNISNRRKQEIKKTLVQIELYLRSIIRKRDMDIPSRDDPGEAILGDE